MIPLELREDIPAVREGVYLNHGAHGPSPQSVVDAATQFINEHEYEVPIDDDPYKRAFAEYEATRERVAEFVGAADDEIALTESTVAGINAISGAIDWGPGDVVVRTDLEHPAGILPWQRLEEDGVEVRVVDTENGRIDPESYADAVDDADLVCFSAVTWTHGTRLPVEELVAVAKDAGAFTLVDAVQVPGQLPFDVGEWGADAVAAAGHKWLLGLWGGGFLYVDRDAAADLNPRTVGYRSVETPTAAELTFAPGAKRFEVGSANPGPHVALREAIDIIDDVGVGRIHDRIVKLAGRFVDGVPREHLLGPDQPETGLVSVDVDDPEGTVERLSNDGIIVRDLPYPEAIRVSIHAVNTAEDVDQVLDALESEW